ncbi:UNVERIFIED_CONTAM: hypothetical protein FKN15_008898 [Acipenser sinensis]
MCPPKRVPTNPSFFALRIHSEATRPIMPDGNTDLNGSTAGTLSATGVAGARLNAEKWRQQLQEVTRENQGFLERITIQQSEYQRQRWEEDWGRTERCRDDIARYKKVLFQQDTDLNEKQTSSSLSEHCDQANKVDSEH